MRLKTLCQYNALLGRVQTTSLTSCFDFKNYLRMYKMLNNPVVIFCRLCYNPFESGALASRLGVRMFSFLRFFYVFCFLEERK